MAIRGSSEQYLHTHENIHNTGAVEYTLPTHTVNFEEIVMCTVYSAHVLYSDIPKKMHDKSASTTTQMREIAL